MRLWLLPPCAVVWVVVCVVVSLSPKAAAAQATALACPAADEQHAALQTASDALAQSRFPEAQAMLEPLATHGCTPQAALLLAAAQEAQGQPDAAITTLKTAHGHWPEEGSLSASLARLYFAQHKQAAAAAALAHYAPAASTPLPQLELCTVVWLASHELPRATDAAKLAWTSYPSLETLLLFANALQLEGRYKDAIALLEPQRHSFGDSAPLLITLAESESDAKLYDRARADLEHALQLEPARYQAHYLLGNLLAQTGETDAAIAQYRAAIEQAPAQPRTYYQLALALRTKEDEAGERAALEQALAADPHYGAAHCELGRMLLRDGQAKQAVAQLEAATQENPQNEQAYYLLSKAWERLGDHARSDSMAKRLAEVRASNRNHADSSSSEPARAAVAPAQ